MKKVLGLYGKTTIMKEKETEADKLIKKKHQSEKSFNGLDAQQWAKLCRNVFVLQMSPRTEEQKAHGSTFPVELAERMITCYSKVGDKIYDPFLGQGTTIEACLNLGRIGFGTELNPEFYKMALRFNKKGTHIYNTDCRNLLEYIDLNSIQAVITSPPYANFIHKIMEDRKNRKELHGSIARSSTHPYSKSKKDFGNIGYNDFLLETEMLMKKLYEVVKVNGYNIWIVKDYRDPKNKIPYVPFHIDIIKAGENGGFILHDILIWDQNDWRKLMVSGFPTAFYANINSTYIIIFRKVK